MFTDHDNPHDHVGDLESAEAEDDRMRFAVQMVCCIALIGFLSWIGWT